MYHRTDKNISTWKLRRSKIDNWKFELTKVCLLLLLRHPGGDHGGQPGDEGLTALVSPAALPLLLPEREVLSGGLSSPAGDLTSPLETPSCQIWTLSPRVFFSRIDWILVVLLPLLLLLLEDNSDWAESSLLLLLLHPQQTVPLLLQILLPAGWCWSPTYCSRYETFWLQYCTSFTTIFCLN